MVKLLLEKGSEADSDDSDGQTPLSYAAVSGHKGVIKLLHLSKAPNYIQKIAMDGHHCLGRRKVATRRWSSCCLQRESIQT